MDAKELRIGNYVSVNRFGVDIPAIIERGSEIDNCDIENYQSVLLTEQWFLDFGYVRRELNGFICYTIKDNLILFCNEMFIADKIGVNIKHVHQLQNLFFCLTGEELKVKQP